MFKKVIGQDANEATKPSLPAYEGRSVPEVASAPARETAPSPAVARPASGGARNVLSTDVEIKGTVKFQNDLIVDGKIEGEVQSTGNLTVGENARIKAEIKTGTVIVYGKVHGNMTAVDRVELKASAEVVGDIKAKILTIEAGAIFVGKSTIGTPSEGAAASAASKTSAPAQQGNSQPQPSAKG